MSPLEKYLLNHLTAVAPHGRTFKELSWWVRLDKETGNLKDALASLKRQGKIEYVDPTGWRIKQ